MRPMQSMTGLGLAALCTATLAACGGSEPRGQLSFTPRPELTAPPGEMSAQRLILMKGTVGETKGKSLGSIAIAPEGPGVLLRIDLRSLSDGTQLLSFTENDDCGAEEIEGKIVPAAAAGLPWGPEDKPIQLPAVEPDEGGVFRGEQLVRGLSVNDTRGRAIVLIKGGQRIGCGIAR
jgi:Cu/Zn superoxide dismutase